MKAKKPFATISISAQALALSRKSDDEIFKILSDRINLAQKSIINEAWEIYLSDGTNKKES